MNRYLRRLRRFGKSQAAQRSQGEMANTQGQIFDSSTTQDVSSVRAKNSRHGQVTADKWNQ
jgi:hypothetical protein